MKPVRFLNEAREELLFQVAYYEERQKGLGERVHLAVRAATRGVRAATGSAILLTHRTAACPRRRRRRG